MLFHVLAATVFLIGAMPAGAGVVGYYRFEEQTAGAVPAVDGGIVDSSGSGNPFRATSASSAPVYTTGIGFPVIPASGAANGSALDFVSSDELYSQPGTPLRTKDFDRFTIEAWVRFDVAGGIQTFVGRDRSVDTAEPPALFYLQNYYGQFRVEASDSTKSRTSVSGVSGITAGTWYHVAAVADAGTLSLYVNGRLQGTTSFSAGLYNPTDDTTWTIGRGQYNGAGADFLDGQVDEVRFSDEALAPAAFLYSVSAGSVANDLTLNAVDRFDGYADGALATVSGGNWQTLAGVTAPVVRSDGAAGDKHVRFGAATSGGAFPWMARTLAADQIVPATGVSTFHFRVRPRGARLDHSMGLTDSSAAAPAFTEFRTQALFLNAAQDGANRFRILVRNGGAQNEVLTSAPKGQWYDVWMVVDRDRNVFDLHFAAEGQPPALLANDVFYRVPTSLPFSRILAVSNGTQSDDLAIDYDHFSVCRGRADLTRPNREGILPGALRIASFNTHGGHGDYAKYLTAFRDNYVNGEHVICLQEVMENQWNGIKAIFPAYPHTMLTVKRTTAAFPQKTECIAILSSLPFVETNAAIMQIDPTVDRWERWAQHVRVDLGGGQSAQVFHFHNTYNFDANDFEWEKSGMVKFTDYMKQQTGAGDLMTVPNLVAAGDFNLTNPAQVSAILPLVQVCVNGRDYLVASGAARGTSVLYTNPVLSDHNGVAATFPANIVPDRYEKWAQGVFSKAEITGSMALATSDADGDGMDNFTEYALNLHPLRSQSSAARTGVEAGRAFATFRRGPNRKDVRYTLLKSIALDGWLNAGIAENGGMTVASGGADLSEMPADGGESLDLTVRAPLESDAEFYRLKTEAVE